jgi:transposase
MINHTAEQLVFFDESLFKLATGWRCMAYGPIGTYIRWQQDIRRGDTYSVLPAYTVDGYLPCTGIKKGYYNGEELYQWVINGLLPYCNAYPGPRSVICLDNASVHVDVRIRQAVEAKGCLIHYLPPYSPDYNAIELTFSVLKAWMRRHWRSLRPQFQGDFEGFLRYAVNVSGCDRFAKEHYRHACNGWYRFEGDYEALQRDLDAWSRQGQ